MNGLLKSRRRANKPVEGPSGHVFATGVFLPTVFFVALWVGLFVANITYVKWTPVGEAIVSQRIQAALVLSLWTTALTTVIGMLFAIPMGYALSRYRFPGHAIVDTIVDIPIILPPLVVGLALLVTLRPGTVPGIERIGDWFLFRKSGIVLCQVLVSSSFGIRVMKLTFDGIDKRVENVALTLGSNRIGAFFRVSLPMAWRGIAASAILVWTRALGIFAPIQMFVGAVPERTEILPTVAYLEQSVGQLEPALAAAVVMVMLVAGALVGIRAVGLGKR